MEIKLTSAPDAGDDYAQGYKAAMRDMSGIISTLGARLNECNEMLLEKLGLQIVQITSAAGIDKYVEDCAVFEDGAHLDIPIRCSMAPHYFKPIVVAFELRTKDVNDRILARNNTLFELARAARDGQ